MKERGDDFKGRLYELALENARTCGLGLPSDLTHRDVDRIERFLRALPIEEPPAELGAQIVAGGSLYVTAPTPEALAQAVEMLREKRAPAPVRGLEFAVPEVLREPPKVTPPALEPAPVRSQEPARVASVEAPRRPAVAIRGQRGPGRANMGQKRPGNAPEKTHFRPEKGAAARHERASVAGRQLAAKDLDALQAAADEAWKKRVEKESATPKATRKEKADLSLKALAKDAPRASWTPAMRAAQAEKVKQAWARRRKKSTPEPASKPARKPGRGIRVAAAMPGTPLGEKLPPTCTACGERRRLNGDGFCAECLKGMEDVRAKLPPELRIPPDGAR